MLEEVDRPRVNVVAGADGLARRAFSAADVRRMLEAGIMDENEPFELVEGELVFMNAQGFAHDLIKTALARKLGRFLAEDFFVAAEVSVQLTDSSIVQPDLVVGHKSAVMSSTEGFLTIPAAQILLIVEVAATSLSFNRGRKAALYAREGITEYWVIDAGKRLAWMHRRPSAEGFREVTSVAAEEELRPAALELRDFAIRVRDLN
jgi:Uma2 family endonuclease